MEIIDKYGYLESALEYIERCIVSGRGLQKTAKKAGINEDLLRNLSLALSGFSERQFFIILQEKIEERHSSLSGADVEISGADISIEIYPVKSAEGGAKHLAGAQKGKAFVSMNILCDIVIDGESEDKVKMDVKIFSKNNIQIIV